MPIINEKLLKNEEVQRDARQANWFIVNCLDAFHRVRVEKVFLSAYLLFAVSSLKDPANYSYDKLSTLKVNEDIKAAINDVLSEEEWSKLLAIVDKFSPEVFAFVAFTTGDLIDFRMSDTYATPESIIKLSQSILNMQAKDSVADICCGYGTFLFSSAVLEPKASYYGYDINPENKLIATIKAELVGADTNIISEDAFSLFNNKHEPRFNKIFSNYPFGLPKKNLSGTKFYDEVTLKIPELKKASSSDWFFNALLLDRLMPGGKAVGIMTNGSTWNGADAPVRKYFVENGFIESVIALPPKMFSAFSIPTSLIVLSYGNEKIRLVDATKNCIQGRRFSEFSEENIDSIIDALSNDSEFSREISVDELKDNEYTLSLSRYLDSGIKFKDAAPFESVIKNITRGAPCTAQQLDEMNSDRPTDMQYLLLANIKNGIIDEELPYLSYIDPKHEKYCLKNNNLILSKNGYPYKVAVAQVSEGQKILANGNLFIIELDEEKADPYYLKAFFESESGIAVLKSITVGATIPNIGIDKLKKVNIPLPSLDEQKKISDLYKATLDEISIYNIKLNKAYNRLHHIFDEESEA